MGIREDVIALADELEALERDGCEECIVYGQPECSGELPCAETVALYSARKMREAVEHDADDATTVSVYDLLPDEDRKAIAWVREHGGLDTAVSRFESGENASEMLWGKGHGRFWTADDFEEEISKRLMPAGYEWPRFEDGEPVRFGDEFADGLGNTRKCQSIELLGGDDGVCDAAIRWGEHDDEFLLVCVWQGERVKRPAPKVLDADGVEIRQGDTVWFADGSLEDYGPHIAESVNANPGLLRIETIKLKGCNYPFPASSFTHRAPVLAADGKPLRVGETVYKLEDSRPYTVKRIDGDHVYINAGGKEFDIWTFPGKLTHEQPDTWERLEADAEGGAKDYCAERGLAVDGCAYGQAKAVDLVRRARRLAGRGA